MRFQSAKRITLPVGLEGEQTKTTWVLASTSAGTASIFIRK